MTPSGASGFKSQLSKLAPVSKPHRAASILADAPSVGSGRRSYFNERFLLWNCVLCSGEQKIACARRPALDPSAKGFLQYSQSRNAG
jgi:hypothetical protein